MAKDDYFVIAYRMLTYLYECFKAGENPEAEMISPEALRINRGYWMNTLESLQDEGYIKGIFFNKTLGNIGGAKFLDMKITQKGIEFLQENSSIQKAKEFLKGVKDIIPGI